MLIFENSGIRSHITVISIHKTNLNRLFIDIYNIINLLINGVYVMQAPPVHTVTYRNAPDFFNEATYYYTASVVFTHTTEKQTGNYSCHSVENPEISAFLYVFVPGKNL